MSIELKKRKFMLKKPVSIEDKIIRYIKNGIEEKRFTIYKFNDLEWYGVHIKKFLAPSIGSTPGACLKALKRMYQDKRLYIRWKIWERQTWEIAVRILEYKK